MNSFGKCSKSRGKQLPAQQSTWEAKMVAEHSR